MWTQGYVNSGTSSQVSLFPQVSHFGAAGSGEKSVPWQSFRCRLFAQVEDSDVVVVLVRSYGGPCPNCAFLECWMPSRAMLVHLEYFIVGDKRGGGGIEAGEIPTKYQRRAKNRPQSHDRSLLIGSEFAWRAATLFRRDPQLSEGQHVRIRPGVVPAYVYRPIAGVVELLLEQLPVVPEIV